MPRRSHKTIAEQAGLSVAQLHAAKESGVNIYKDEELAEWKSQRRPRAGGAEEAGGDVFECLDDIERAILRAGSYNEAQKLKSQVQALKDLVNTKKAEGDLIPRAKVDERDTRIAAAVKSVLMKFCNEAPPMLEGLPADKVQKVLVKQMTGVLETLADDQQEFWRDE